nr:pitrilysin family protein [uncultured Peptostreptococcus sp.]
MTNMKIIDLGDSVSLGLIANKKFKSNLISIYFQRKLDRKDVTRISLLTNLMQVATNKYPNMKAMSQKMDNMYGLSMNLTSSKYGEKLITCLKLLSISDKYIEQPVFEDVIDFASEILLNPLVVDDKLNPTMLDIEKKSLEEEIRSKINDKRSYANLRCIELMCKDEPYSIDPLGYIEDLDTIDASIMYETYKDLISTSKIFIMIEGDFDEEKVKKLCVEKFKFKRTNVQTFHRESYSYMPSITKFFQEDMSTNQAKLVIGLRTGVDYQDYDRYYSLMVGNSIFGGGPHSKLFNNVREKESICYYASSNLEKTKGLMFISSGIDAENYNKARELISKELEDTKTGNITSIELENAKKSIINSLKSVGDSIISDMDFLYNQYVSNSNLSLEEVISYIEKVDINMIIESMKDVKEDTVFFLK